jgi:phosphoribosyl-dephospho-CoA transferase
MFFRHDLVWLSARGWERACRAAPPASRDAILRWGAADWPAVVTRRPAGLPAGQVALGIALPPRPLDGSKPRIGMAADAADIVRGTGALPLAEAIPAAPARWRTALAMLLDEAAGADLTLHVYGSLAFQAVTGQAYLNAGSDIDLLLHPATPACCRRALALLERYAGGNAAVLPLDGEFVFGGAQAVAWKELATCRDRQARVLAKSLDGVALVTVERLLASLEKALPCTA